MKTKEYYLTELGDVHQEICRLEKKKQRMYWNRAKQIAEQKIVPEQGTDEFCNAIQDVDIRLNILWNRKRELLGHLGDPFIMGIR